MLNLHSKRHSCRPGLLRIEGLHMLLRFPGRVLFFCMISCLMTACQTTSRIAADLGSSIASVVQLAKNGYDFSLEEDDAKFRNDLYVSAKPVSFNATYNKVDRCYYNIGRSSTGREALLKRRASLVVRPVGDKYMSILSVDNMTSSALIDGGGRVYDFNVFHSFNNRRLTTEGQGLPKRINISNKSVGISQLHNPLSLLQPEFVDSRWDVNQIVSAISLLPDQESLAYLKYKGVSQFNGASVLVLDIIYNAKDRKGGVLWTSIGFSLLDVETRLPIVFVFQFQDIRFRLDQISCLAVKS